MTPYWLRQAIALGIGIAWGFAQLTGWMGLLGFALVMEAAVLGYKNATSEDDEEDLEDEDDAASTSKFDGFMPALGVFLCAWIFCYNLTLDY